MAYLSSPNLQIRFLYRIFTQQPAIMNKILILIISIIFISCQRHYTDNEVILTAERMLDNSPDSAFNLLSSIRNPQNLPSADYAAWCLQYTHACYKLQKEFTSDSIIRVSVSYYRNSKLKKQSGSAYYLLGCISEILNKEKEAMEAYKEAENALSSTDEFKLKGLVQFSLGYICMQDEMYSKSLGYFRKSLNYFNQSGSKKYSAYALRDISKMYNQLNYSLDSVLFYSNRALKLAYEAADSVNYYSILSHQGILLYDKDYNRSIAYLLKSVRYFPENRSYYSAFLSYSYSKLKDTQSANYYLKIANRTQGYAFQNLVGLHAAAIIAYNKAEYRNAYKYLEESYVLRDSMTSQNIASQLHRIDKQYDFTQKEIENKSLKIANQTKIIWIVSLAVSFLIVLVMFLLIRSKSRQKQAENEIEKQRLKFERETIETQNLQKRELLKVKIQHKIENTLAFNKLNKSIMAKGKKDELFEEVKMQATLSEKDWSIFIKEVDNLFESRISKLKQEYTNLTDTDCIVIALVCLKINIPDSCLLLDMSKNTLYNRRKTIKIRLNLDADTDLDKWIDDYCVSKK